MPINTVSLEDLENGDYGSGTSDNWDGYGSSETEGYGDGETQEITSTPIDTSETPEALEVDVNNAEEVMDEAGEAVDDHLEAVDELTEVAQELYNIKQEYGYIDPQAAKFIHISVEHALNKLEGRDRNMALPSLESFRHTSSAVRATEVSLEGIIDKLSITLNKVRLRVEKYIKSFFQFINSWTPLIDRLIKRAQAVKEKAKQTDVKGGKEINYSRAGDMRMENGIPTPDTVMKSSKAWAAASAEILKPATLDKFFSFLEESLKVISSEAGTEFVKTSIFDQVDTVLMIKLSSLPSVFKLAPLSAKFETTEIIGFDLGEDYEARRSEYFVGGYHYITAMPRPDHRNGFVKISQTTPAIESSRKNITYSDAKTMQGLSSKQVVELADLVIETLESAREQFKNFRERNNRVEQFYRQVKLERIGSGSAINFLNDKSRLLHYTSRFYKVGIVSSRYSVADTSRSVASLLVGYMEASVNSSVATESYW